MRQYEKTTGRLEHSRHGQTYSKPEVEARVEELKDQFGDLNMFPDQIPAKADEVFEEAERRDNRPDAGRPASGAELVRLPASMTHNQLIEYLAVLRMGLPETEASDLAGVPQRTINHWLKRGRELYESGWDCLANPNMDESAFVDFFRAITRARTEGRIRLVQSVWKASSRGNWKAAAWLLERLYPDQFGKRVKMDHTLHTEDMVQDGLNMSAEQRKQRLQELDNLRQLEQAAGANDDG